jgi:hypothetical protein
MDGRAFLPVARELLQRGTEAHWRAAAGRAYYALMLECRSALLRWGFTVPGGPGVHNFLRLRFNQPKDATLRIIGRALDDLCLLRNYADYEIPVSRAFANDRKARWSVDQARDALDQLNALDTDPAQRSAAITAIQTAWP